MSVVVITGSSRGIGAATARLAAERGHDVCVNFRADEAAAEAVVADVRAAGRRAIAVQADVASEPDVVRLFETVDEKLGMLAGLVNNAGVLERQTRVEQIDAARRSRVFATNVTGAFVCAREAIRRMPAPAFPMVTRRWCGSAGERRPTSNPDASRRQSVWPRPSPESGICVAEGASAPLPGERAAWARRRSG